MTRNLWTKEIHELKEMLRFTGKKKSRFNEDVSLDKVVENIVLRPPHITCITVYKIMRGGE